MQSHSIDFARENLTVMHKGTRWITLERADKFMSEAYFKDINLRSKIHPKNLQVPVKLAVFSVPDLKRIPYSEAIQGKFIETKVGSDFGPSWSTHWFRIDVKVPNEWKGQTIHFIWDSASEAMIWRDGIPIQAFTGGNGVDRRAEYELVTSGSGEEEYSFYVEMACNGMFGNGKDGDINAPDPNRTFNLKTACIGVFDRLAFDLYMDLKVIYEIAKELPEESSRGKQALWVVNEMMNVMVMNDRKTWLPARKVASEFLSETNGSSQHQIFAVGHCHIDVAWLWPYDETKRKTARSFATQLLYMEKYPDYRFAQSNAQLYQWMKELYPELYAKIKEKVKSGQLIPIGGTWVEQCGNLPGGESHVRQFMYGQRFFKQEFGMYCTEFWLPDSFGYNAQLVQIMRSAKIDSFVTQKLSWNLFNKFPHSSFLWQGLDGSRVFAHFPPSDTYNDMLTLENLLKSVSNFKDKERSKHSLTLFGHGDGGGGPNIDMLERLERLKDVDCIPKIKQVNPKVFFDKMKEENAKKPLNVWHGELYMEGHRGTYTSQALTKKGNRKGEFLLREVEAASLIAFKLRGRGYASERIESLWKLLCLNQFHDVLPGSSIGLVYDDAHKHYEEIQSKGVSLRDIVLTMIINGRSMDNEVSVFNSLNWDRKEVIELPFGYDSIQKSHDGKQLGLVSVPSIGYAKNSPENWNEQLPLSIKEDNGAVIMENTFIKATFDKFGRFDLYDKRVDRVTIEKGNQFVFHEDIPLFWDAWDVEIYHLQKKENLELGSIKIVEQGPLRVSISLFFAFGESRIEQVISLTGVSARLDFKTNVNWNENRKMLKVSFPTTIQSPEATFEVQYGHFKRPTTWNTSWDVARFEVPCQKWCDLSEFGYGIALLNDCKYGCNIHDGFMNLSLLRAPKSPDDNCDIGAHQFVYSIFPHEDTFQDGCVIQESYNLNSPLQITKSVSETKSFFSVDKKNIVIEAIKKAEDSEDLVIRLYEAFGGKISAKLTCSLEKRIKAVYLSNILEERGKKVDFSDNTIPIQLSAFQIVTLIVETE